MTEYRDYPYDSVLAPYIRDYISEKRALGFIYNGKGYQLFRLDKYWIAHGYNDVCITPDRLDEWLRAFPGESRSSHGSRIRAARDLAVYISLHGSPCHVPFINAGRDHPVVHLMDRTELHEFFSEVDSYVPRSISHTLYDRMEYSREVSKVLRCFSTSEETRSLHPLTIMTKAYPSLSIYRMLSFPYIQLKLVFFQSRSSLATLQCKIM